MQKGNAASETNTLLPAPLLLLPGHTAAPNTHTHTRVSHPHPLPVHYVLIKNDYPQLSPLVAGHGYAAHSPHSPHTSLKVHTHTHARTGHSPVRLLSHSTGQQQQRHLQVRSTISLLAAYTRLHSNCVSRSLVRSLVSKHSALFFCTSVAARRLSLVAAVAFCSAAASSGLVSTFQLRSFFISLPPPHSLACACACVCVHVLDSIGLHSQRRLPLPLPLPLSLSLP